MNNNRLEILNANFYENRKFEEELARIYGAGHPKRIRIAKETEELRVTIVREQNPKKTKK